MIAAMVAPFGCRSIASTVSCLDGAEVAGFDGRDFFGAAFDAAGGLLVRLAGRRTEGADLRAASVGFGMGLRVAIAAFLPVNDSIMRCHWHGPADGGAMEDCGGGG